MHPPNRITGGLFGVNSTERTTAIRTFDQLRNEARTLGSARVAIVCAEDDVALTAASEAHACGIANPLLFGRAAKIVDRATALGLVNLLDSAQIIDVAEPMEAARVACRMAASGVVDPVEGAHSHRRTTAGRAAS